MKTQANRREMGVSNQPDGGARWGSNRVRLGSFGLAQVAVDCGDWREKWVRLVFLLFGGVEGCGRGAAAREARSASGIIRLEI